MPIERICDCRFAIVDSARRRRGGFTLIECLVTGMILAIFGTALIGGVMQAVAAGRSAEDQRYAAQFLNEAFTRVDYVGPSVLLTEGPMQGQFNERFQWEAQIEPVELSDLYTVTVTIQWADRGKLKQTQAATQLYDSVGMRPLGRRWEDMDG